MGIRYDRDSQRATNGPMFFFSIVKDETFAEEIKSAYLSGLSFYAYRQPDDKMLCFGSSVCFVEGIGQPGFVISMFSSENPFITIPYRCSPATKNVTGTPVLYKYPEKSTAFEEYSVEVDQIKAAIRRGEGSKVVAARVIVRDESTDIAEKFYDLCQKFPQAYVFCFGTPATGCWIGASPELLLENTGGTFHSMALAGTRPIGTEEDWDEKNIEEQRIVTEYILNVFNKNGLDIDVGTPYTKSAGTIEHICTEILGIRDNESGIRDNESGIREEEWLEKLLRDLSPTPALCGYPKEFAMREILMYEPFDRGCYGGFCGPFHSIHDFHFNVVIRCASITDKRQYLYVGGGITSRSSVSEEWTETQLKADNTFGV